MSSASKLFLNAHRLGLSCVRNAATKSVPSEMEGMIAGAGGVPVVTSLDISAGLSQEQTEFQSLALDFANNEVSCFVGLFSIKKKYI